ncbi:hypothetical protein A3860_05270 [Niastella vici]|uniref:Zinc-dependent metalloprotease n=1 Tax=Niastella vici TaxID=1703345 RepID=A0A1V9FS19_9BACT|nr:zinc-dependent metalloprotease [Niastella vici]OQP61130.1 hypothetical protein A3860_05270 [Niastella vici]
MSVLKVYKYILLLFIVLKVTVGHAQRKHKLPSVNISDTTQKKETDIKIKPFRELIPQTAVSDSGLFNVYRLDDKYYLEIPDNILGKDIMAVGRVSKSAADFRVKRFGYSGDQINEAVIRFEKGPLNKIFLRSVSYSELSKDSTQPMFMAVQNSNLQLIEASFDIKAFSVTGQGNVIDVTDYLNSDNNVLFFESELKSEVGLGLIQKDRSYISSVKSYPVNTEIKTVKTYERKSDKGATTGYVTLELNTSLILLPENPMQPRYADDRVGYFTQRVRDFDRDPHGIKNDVYVTRWRLEPKPEDMEKYKRGELVEPKKPIVFYIDPATPKKWVPYLIAGVNDWQVAFEQAGFKNAIIAKPAPTKEEDSTWSLDDARFSAIVYKPSAISNASGPNVHDPRSGEILESHINWYHNIMDLLKKWYFIQASPNDLRARTIDFPDSLMGDLIRFVSSHEVGHTLGLAHNFGASTAYPVEKLRDKEWVKINGHSPSIMDYARFNYIAQPGDGITGSLLYPKIGVYDKWAIEYGYKLIPGAKTPDAEYETLDNWILEKAKDRKYWFGVQTISQSDPRSQSEDLGDDAVKASYYGIQNLKYILPHLNEWTAKPREGYGDLRIMYKELLNQFNTYLYHVEHNIGGFYKTPKATEQQGPVFEIVPKSKQKQAVQFLNDQLFNAPLWLADSFIMARIPTFELPSSVGLFSASNIDIIGNMQTRMIKSLLELTKLTKMVEEEALYGDKAYSVIELLTDLRKTIWKSIDIHAPIDMYQRNLQKEYIDRLGFLSKPTDPMLLFVLRQANIRYPDPYFSDVSSIVRGELILLQTKIKGAIPLMNDKISLYHLRDLSKRIELILNPK